MGVRSLRLVLVISCGLAVTACGGPEGGGSSPSDASGLFPFADLEGDGSRFLPTDSGTRTLDGTSTSDVSDDSAQDTAEDASRAPDAVGILPDGDAAGPEPDATGPEPDATDPEPDATGPEPDATDPEPDATDPEPDATDPEPDATDPEPDATDPEPDATDPEPDATDPEPEPVPVYNLCGLGKDSPRPPGTWDEPIDAPFSPFVDEGDTTLSLSDQAQNYDCEPGTLEHGPETVYRFTTEHPGDFRAEVLDGVGVDIDLHLLEDPEIDPSGLVTGCLARAHEVLEVDDLPPGDYWLVADSWTSVASSQEFPGAYRIAWEVVSPNVWTEVALREGVSWARARLENAGETQTVNVLRFQPEAGWDLQPHKHSGCKNVGDGMASVDAFAGVNANFFAACAPTDLLKEDGVLHSTNETTSYEQRTMGWNDPAGVQFQWIAPGQDWPEMSNAVGGYPSLVDGGQPLASAKPGQQVWSATDWAQHPRTIVGVDADGVVVLATFDGRTGAGDGYTTPALATWVAQELGLVDAMNLDGGGSTTMVVRDCWMNHTVSYPSDNDLEDHLGLRAVASGLYLR